jgi:tetratricopeptide (TPR) repeat protein
MTTSESMDDHDTPLPISCNGQLACDRYHHFYHYKSSYQHLMLAQKLNAAGDEEGATKHFKAALFQDHLNEAAKIGHAELVSASISKLHQPELLPDGSRNKFGMTKYDTHITSGAIEALVTYERSLGWEEDASMELCARGKFAEALAISSERHDRYHRHASDEHLKRGKEFLRAGEIDLAIADFSKALDLYRGNKEARAARAGAYRAKGNDALAQQDESYAAFAKA